MRMDFTGKRILVTGGTKSVGRAAVEGFAALGATVAVGGRTAPAVERTINELGDSGRLIPAEGDLSQVVECERVVDGAVAALGGLDVLVNGAQRRDDKSIDAVTEDFWEAMLAVNLKATFFCAKFATPALRESRGCIINIASTLGLAAGPDGSTVYGATQGGIVQMSRVLALPYGRDGIRANTVCPGWTEAVPLGRAGTLEEGAAAVLALAWDGAGYTTGATLVADGGFASGH